MNGIMYINKTFTFIGAGILKNELYISVDYIKNTIRTFLLLIYDLFLFEKIKKKYFCRDVFFELLIFKT